MDVFFFKETNINIYIFIDIDRDNLLPPLLVIQILSEKKTATLSLIKDYIIKRLQQENQLITEVFLKEFFLVNHYFFF